MEQFFRSLTLNNAGNSLQAKMQELTAHFENELLGTLFGSVVGSIKSPTGGLAVLATMVSCPPECVPDLHDRMKNFVRSVTEEYEHRSNT